MAIEAFTDRAESDFGHRLDHLINLLDSDLFANPPTLFITSSSIL